MRTYGTTKLGYAKVNKERSKAGRNQLYKQRQSTEWDVRIDCDQDYFNTIIENAKSASDQLDYCLISGREQPDTLKHGSKDIHTHIAVVSKNNMRRDQVLALLRGPLKKTDEYCCPRNTNFTYAGWFLHHTKLDWKLVKAKPIEYEFGELPEDELNDITKKKVKQMFNKFARDDETYQALWRKKFERYLD